MRAATIFILILIGFASDAIAQGVAKASIFAATATEGGKPEVRLQIRIAEGWMPQEGVRIYRELAGTKTEIFRSKPVSDAEADRALDPAMRGLQIWSTASRAFGGPQALDFAVVRPPSSVQRFRELKTAASSVLELRAKGAADAAARESLDRSIQRFRQLTGGAPRQGNAVTAPALRQPPTQAARDSGALAARAKISLMTLVDRDAAEQLGLAAKDTGLKQGDAPTYTLVAVSGGKDGAVLDTLRFTVGSDPQPPAPKNIETMQMILESGDPTGSLAVRWERVDAALEAKLLNVSYRIERFGLAPAGDGGSKRVGSAGGAGAAALRVGKGDAVGGAWTSAIPRPLMISTLEGDLEPESFFTDALDAPGQKKYRIALVDGFGRRSAWTEFEATILEWRRPAQPSGVRAELDEQARDERGAVLRGGPAVPSADQLRAMGMQASRTPVGLGRATDPPRDLTALSAAILSGKGRAAVTVTWSPVDAPAGLSVAYRIYRTDIEAPNAAPQLLTPQPIAGEEAPPRVDPAASASEIARLDAQIATLGGRVRAARTDAAAIADLRQLEALRGAVVRDSRRDRMFTDATVRIDARYSYAVRAVFAPSGLESEDSASAVVSVPSPQRPPAVAGARFVEFKPSESLSLQQLFDSAAFISQRVPAEAASFAAARIGRPRLAPPPSGFKPAGGAAQRPFAVTRPIVVVPPKSEISRPAREGVRSSPGAVAGEFEPSEQGVAQDASRPSVRGPVGIQDLAVPDLAPRLRTFAPEIIRRLNQNLVRSRDDGGTVRIEWTAVANLRDVSYRIRRRVQGESFVEVGVAPRNATSFIDVVPRTTARTYEYEIMAISRWGVLGQIGKQSVVVAAVPSMIRPTKPNLMNASPDIAVDRAVKVRFMPNPAEESVTLYRIFRDGAPVGEVAADAGAVAELVFSDRELDPSRRQPYAYQVVAETSTGLKSEASRTLQTTAVRLEAPAPAQLQATVSAAGVALSWKASSGSASYMVLRIDAGVTAPMVVAASVTGTSCTDPTAYPGNSYRYEVIARDAAGNASKPASVSVTVP